MLNYQKSMTINLQRTCNQAGIPSCIEAKTIHFLRN